MEAALDHHSPIDPLLGKRDLGTRLFHGGGHLGTDSLPHGTDINAFGQGCYLIDVQVGVKV